MVFSQNGSEEKAYVYVFCRRDLSKSQCAVQSGHAIIESQKEFGFTKVHPSIILCDAKSEQKLLSIYEKLNKLGVKSSLFREPDRDNEATAFATEPIFEDRRFLFKNYQLLNLDKIDSSVEEIQS